MHKIIELYKWSYLISFIIYIPYLTHYQLITFGLFLAKVFYNWTPEDVDDVTIFFKRLFEVSKDFNLQLSYYIDWFDSPITDLPKGEYYWRFDAKDRSPFIIRQPITVTLYFTTGFPLSLETYLFSLIKTKYPRVRKKLFRQLKWRVKER